MLITEQLGPKANFAVWMRGGAFTLRFLGLARYRVHYLFRDIGLELPVYNNDSLYEIQTGAAAC